MKGILINRKREKKIDYNKYIVTSFCNIYNACQSAGLYDVHVTLQ